MKLSSSGRSLGVMEMSNLGIMEIVEIWPNLEKKRNTDHDFPPPLYVCGRKMKNYPSKMLKDQYYESFSISQGQHRPTLFY